MNAIQSIDTLTAEKAFNTLKFQCNPKFSIGCLGLEFFNLFIGKEKPINNFSGGCGDLRTTHEKIFSLLYPNYKQQVVFGTGKGGHKKYTSNKFTVDFYNDKSKIVYEIDGMNHNSKLQKLKDQIKEYYLILEHNIKTVRISNKEVEIMLMNRLKELESEGKLKWIA